jgi:hypothetical protein
MKMQQFCGAKQLGCCPDSFGGRVHRAVPEEMRLAFEHMTVHFHIRFDRHSDEELEKALPLNPGPIRSSRGAPKGGARPRSMD